MALVKVLNTSTVPRGVEILNTAKEPDTQSILAHSSIVVDEEDLLTTQVDLTKRGLKVIQLSTKTVVETKVKTSSLASTLSSTTSSENITN